MKVLSVNIGAVRAIEVKGRMTETSIFKVSVPGAHHVGPRGVVGDARVEPRKQFGEESQAVYAYPYEHYGFWEQQLARAPFPAGQFGENLTTAGLLETEARIGDVLRCGSVVMQVTHPRIPCRKLNARMELSFARTFLESRRLGLYLRVLQPGQLQAGDDIVLVERDESSPTMDDFIRISQLDYWDAEGLAWLLRARDLVPGWREVLQEKLERARGADGWFGQRELRVVRCEDEGHGFRSYELGCARGLPLPPFAGGQHLLASPQGASSQDVGRSPLVLSGDPRNPAAYRVTTQGQQYSLAPGDCIRAAAPRGGFSLRSAPATSDALLFVAAGLGLAPVLSMLYELRHQGSLLPVRILQVGDAVPQRLWQELMQLAALVPTLHVQRIASAAALATEPPRSAHAAIFLAGPAEFIEQAEPILRSSAGPGAHIVSGRF